MANRDVEKLSSKSQFVSTLRRLADAIERGESPRIQVLARRITIPAHAELSIEHEIEGDDEEVELQFRWRNGGG
jgi:amphi-Trp domain-containing protein